MNVMEDVDSGATQAADLRREAEQRLHNKNAAPVEGMAEVDFRALLHELQVHQIELEMQNEELLGAQDALRATSDKYHDLFDFAPIGYFRLDEQGRILEVNLAGASLLGLDRNTAVKQRLGQYAAPQARARFAEFLRDVLRGDGKRTFEIELLCGEQRAYALLEGILADDGGAKRSFLVTATNITERKQLDNALRFLLQCSYGDTGEGLFQSLARYLAQSLGMDYVCIDRLVGDGLTANTVAVYHDGTFDDNVTYALQDTPCGEVVGKTICCYPEGVCELFPKDTALQQLKAESYVGTTLWGFDGKPIGLIAIIGRKPLANPFLAESMLKLVAVRAAGELERKHAEDALRRAGERMKEIVRLAPAFMCILRGREHVFEMCNDRYLEIVGNRDVLHLPIRQALPELEEQGFLELLDGVFETGEPYSGSGVPLRVQRTPGKALEEVIIDFVYMPLREVDGSISGIFVHGVDVTEQVLARRRIERLAEEARQAAEELERSNKDLDQFASVASHDLQEPLRVVMGFVQLLQKKYKNQLDAEADQFIEFTVDGTRRMETLIKDLLAYARVGSRGQELTPTDTGAALRQAIGNLSTRIYETAAEITHGKLPTIRADGSQLVQLFQNLLGNALKFRGQEPSKIHVEGARNENHWQFTVRDNGIGIASDAQDRIFAIFERLHTRTQYPGTGIGLAICKRIVERHGGTIWVESQPGQGAAFHFTIPI